MGKGGSGTSLLGVIIAIIAVVGGLIAIYKLVPSLFKFFLWGLVILVVLVIATIVVLIILANKSGKNKDADPRDVNLDDEQTEILKSARAQLMELRRVIMQIHVMDVRTTANSVCGTIDKILLTLREKPDKIKDTRQCLNYYIPTLTDVLRHYQTLQDKGHVTEDMTGKVKSFLGDVQTGLSKQYSNLFEADKLNMEVDMEALTIAIRRDGLL